MLNYKHLHYFWAVAREGGIMRASERLHLTPQTISGQLGLLEDHLGLKLFKKVGRNLELTDNGRLVFSYADEIFSLGGEMEESLRQLPVDRPQLFRVGIIDVAPKSITHRILKPALLMPDPIRMMCREADLDTLLAELTVHRLDMVLSDRPVPPNVSTKAFSHKLGESSISFFASPSLEENIEGEFPACLDDMPILLPSSHHQLRSAIDVWLDKHRIYPRIVAEFDDSALMKAFGKESAGIFVAPSTIQEEVEQQYGVKAIGHVEEIKERFYAISVERKVMNPVAMKILEAARELLFMER